MIFADNKEAPSWAFPAILAAAFILRVTGIGYGLPHVYHQDEPMMVNNAVAIGHTGWNTGYFVIPPFVSYLLFVLYAIYFAAGSLIGRFAGSQDFALSFFIDPTPFYWIGRAVIGASFGTATVAVVYALGRRFLSPSAGVLAAALLAVFPYHVQHSHYIYADAPLGFAVALLFYRLFSMVERPSFKNYCWMGAVFGAAIAVKYTAAYFLPAIAAAHCFAIPRVWVSKKGWQAAAVSVVAAIVTFFLIAPYTFLDWSSFWATIQRQSEAETVTGLTHHFLYSIVGGTALFVPVLSAAGFIRIGRRLAAFAWVLGTGAAAYYAVNSMFAQHFARYMLPLAPLLALTAGAGLDWVRGLLGPKRRTLLTAFVFLSLAVPAVYSDYLFLKTDTRTRALQWMEANAEDGAGVALANRFFSPRLLQTPGQLNAKAASLDGPRAEGRRKKIEMEKKAGEGRKSYAVYSLLEKGFPEPDFIGLKPFVSADPVALETSGIDYLVMNRSEITPAFERLKEEGRMKLAARFSPYRDPSASVSADPYDSTGAPHLAAELFRRERLGPVIEIYRIERERAS